MIIKARPYRDEDDYWRIRAFLRDVFLRNRRTELSWQVARLDYWRWHGIRNCGHGSIDGITIWEADGRIAAVLNPESPGEAFLQVDPELRTPELEQEMVAVAEGTLSVPSPEGGREVHVWAFDHDQERIRMLRERGYVPQRSAEHHRFRALAGPLPFTPLPAPRRVHDCVVRALRGDDEIPSRSHASWRAFHAAEPEDRYEGWAWYRNIQQAPLYRRDLDIVGMTEDGEVGAFCTLWYDDVTRTAYFEPVGRRPECEHHGLMRELMFEAMRRVQAMGAVAATVSGFTLAANTLYASVMSLDCVLSRPWARKSL